MESFTPNPRETRILSDGDQVDWNSSYKYYQTQLEISREWTERTQLREIPPRIVHGTLQINEQSALCIQRFNQVQIKDMSMAGPVLIMSALNRYRLFFLSLFPKQ